jgi:hypothetical protein
VFELKLLLIEEPVRAASIALLRVYSRCCSNRSTAATEVRAPTVDSIQP